MHELEVLNMATVVICAKAPEYTENNATFQSTSFADSIFISQNNLCLFVLPKIS